MSELNHLLDRLDDVVTLPVVVQQVISATRQSSVTPKELARLIETDPVLAAKILRTANSSLFGFLFKARDVENAVVRLGTKRVRSIAAALGVGKVFANDKLSFGYSRLGVWKHSVSVGLMNEVLMQVCKVHGVKEVAGEALVAGLVHDIGIIFEEQLMPETFFKFPEQMMASKRNLLDLERRELGFDHAEFGSAILNRWRLPSPVVDAVRYHHRPFDHKKNLLGLFTAMSEILTVTHKIGFFDLRQASRSEFGRLQTRLGLVGRRIIKARTLFDNKIQEALDVFSLDESGTDTNAEVSPKTEREKKKRTGDTRVVSKAAAGEKRRKSRVVMPRKRLND